MEAFPNILSSFPKVRKSFPNVLLSLLNIEKQFPNILLSFPKVKKSFPNVLISFPNIGKSFFNIGKCPCAPGNVKILNKPAQRRQKTGQNVRARKNYSLSLGRGLSEGGRETKSAAFRNETWNPGLYHRVEPASGLNPVDLVNGSFWNLREVVVLASSLQSFRGGKDGCSTLDRPGEQDLGRASERFAGRWPELPDLPAGRAVFHDPMAQMPKKQCPSACRTPTAPSAADTDAIQPGPRPV